MDEQQLLERLERLENKVDYINMLLGVKKNPIPNKEVIPPRPNIPLPQEQKKTIKKEDPTNLLPILGVACFGFAAIFIVKLAIDSGWLTPVRQWGLLLLFGLTLSLLGLFVEFIEKSYRSYLGAAGSIVLFIAAYSSSLYFNLFPSIVSLVLGAIVALFSIFLFNFFRSELFILICAIGTYIAPLLLKMDVDFIYISGFFLIWAGLFSRIAIYLNTRTLTLIASYLGLGCFAYIFFQNNQNYNQIEAAIVQSMQFLIFASGVYFYSSEKKIPMSVEESWAYFPILLFFYGTTYSFISLIDTQLASIASLGFAAFIFVLYWRARKLIKNLSSQIMIESFLSIVVFHSGYLQLMPAAGKPWLLPIIVIGLYASKLQSQKISLPLKFLFGMIALVEYLSICFKLLTESSLQTVINSAVTIIVGFLLHSKIYKSIEDKESLFLGLLHSLTIITLYRLSYDYGTFMVSLVWGLYSLIILGFGYLKRQKTLAKSSLIVLVVASLKALTYDVGQSSTENRIGALIFTGAILYGAGYLFQKISKWNLEIESAKNRN